MVSHGIHLGRKDGHAAQRKEKSFKYQQLEESYVWYSCVLEVDEVAPIDELPFAVPPILAFRLFCARPSTCIE